jgi:hypothetical protein
MQVVASESSQAFGGGHQQCNCREIKERRIKLSCQLIWSINHFGNGDF